MSHTIEGDGVALNVYHHMWKKKLNNIEDGFSVRLPHTVVYEHDFAKGWYFWSEKKEEIERRFGKEIESKAVLREFLQPTIAANGDRPRRRDGAQTECVAYYLSSRPNGGVAVDFLDAAELQEFLMKPSHTREHGILQQLVPAGGVSTTTIQAVWSPHVTLVEKRQNIHQAADRRLSLFDRMATYEGPPHLSRESAVPSRVHWQVQQLCETFTAHFQSTEHMAITRMVLYFRLDALGDLWFLWSSSIRVARAAQLQLSPRFGPPRSRLEADATTRQLLDAATKIPVPSLDTPSGETTHTQRVKSIPALPSLLERVTAAYADRSTMLRQNKALADFVAPRTAPRKSRIANRFTARPY